MKPPALIAILAAVSAAGCHLTPWHPPSSTALTPQLNIEECAQDDNCRTDRCGEIRASIAREQNYARNVLIYNAYNSNPASGATNIIATSKANSRISGLEDEASRLGCSAAFGAILDRSKMTFYQCFAKCKQITARDDSACFDSCNK